jgi:hypothetical protein
METYGGGGIAPQFLVSALDGSEWLASRFGRFIPGEKNPWYPFDRRLDGLQSRSGRCEEEKNLVSLPGIELRPSSPARRYTDWAVVTRGDDNYFGHSVVQKNGDEIFLTLPGGPEKRWWKTVPGAPVFEDTWY